MKYDNSKRGPTAQSAEELNGIGKRWENKKSHPGFSGREEKRGKGKEKEKFSTPASLKEKKNRKRGEEGGWEKNAIKKLKPIVLAF